MTPNGKLDRAALPQPEVERLTIRFCPPRNPTEEILCAVWQEVLRADLIGIDDHFFAMGGHSLLAVQIISCLRKLFQIELEVRRLFEFPTIRQLAVQIETGGPSAGGVTPVILARTASGFNPLSFAQERLWFLDQMEEKSATYNMSRALRLRGALDAGALEGGFRAIISRQEALRTTFQSREGTPFQEISERVALPFVTLDLRGFPEPERWEEFHRGALADARTPFDLAKGPLLRVRLCRMEDEENLLAVTLHHIISDGWSLGIFMRELSLIYRELTAGSRPALPPRASLGNTAYLMYTSGTTGLPKGAMIEHGGMLNHLYAKIGDTGMSGGDVMAQTASQRFDIFIYQFLAALVLGGRTRIYRDDTANDPGRLFQASDRDGVTLLEIVPSLMGLFLDDLACGRLQAPPLRTLRWLIPTGEALPPKLCRLWFRFYPSIPLLNAYGHTETSDDVAHFAIRTPPEPEVARMSIGKPVPNTKIYILDSCLLPVPIGVVGRLYVGGAQVGRGYLNRPELTAAVFLPDPFSRVPGARFYDSGDQRRFLPDGCIDYLGRLDHMVKIRGNRVELGEIEAALLKHPDIRSAVVLAREEGHAEDKELVGYVCLAAGTGLGSQPAGTASVLIGFLKERLPSFMIPGSFVFLENLPLTANGKVDRKALVRPDRSGRESGVEPIALRTVTEAKVATIWREVLKRSEVGPTDDFFEIGGHSLLATQVASRIRKEFGIELPIRLLFEIPVLSGLADWLDQQTLELADPAILEAILEEIDAVSDEESAQPLRQPHD